MTTPKKSAGQNSEPALELVKGADGGVHLVGTFKGAKLELASVNASQVHAARVAQGLGPDDDDDQGDELETEPEDATSAE